MEIRRPQQHIRATKTAYGGHAMTTTTIRLNDAPKPRIAPAGIARQTIRIH